MIRLALIGGAASWHGRAFSGLINGAADGQTVPADWANYKKLVEDARIVTVYDDDAEAARSLASVFGIDRVSPSLEDAADGVDGILVTDDGSQTHQRRAAPFLQRGLPTFIDKPLSADVAEAEAIVALAAAHNAPLMSCSALRFASETAELRHDPGLIGDIEIATTVCGGELVYYGIHALEMAHAIMGDGVKKVHNVGQPDRHVVKLTYADGRTLILIVYASISYVFQVNLHGTTGRRDIVVIDDSGFYANMLAGVVEMVRTGKSPVAPTTTLEIVRILAAAAQSLRESREITIAP